jgi:hypothetical protein
MALMFFFKWPLHFLHSATERRAWSNISRTHVSSRRRLSVRSTRGPLPQPRPRQYRAPVRWLANGYLYDHGQTRLLCLPANIVANLKEKGLLK